MALSRAKGLSTTALRDVDGSALSAGSALPARSMTKGSESAMIELLVGG